ERLRAAGGSAAEGQRVLQDNASAQVRIFQSTIETLSIAIGERFTPNIKQIAIALTAQAAQLLKYEAFLQNFEGVSDAAAQAVATLLRVGADFVPIFTLAGGAVLIFTRNLDTLILTARIAFAI